MSQVEAFALPAAAEKDRRYTLPDTMARCMALAKVQAWDLDVAAEPAAHHALNWYGVEQDGLRQQWWGRVWCNPPYSDIASWVTKAWMEWTRACEPITIAMLLPANRTEQPWWQLMVEPCRDDLGHFRVHFLPGRDRFGTPADPTGEHAGSPRWGSVLLVWRKLRV